VNGNSPRSSPISQSSLNPPATLRYWAGNVVNSRMNKICEGQYRSSPCNIGILLSIASYNNAKVLNFFPLLWVFVSQR
jgi:hypothetical protein